MITYTIRIQFWANDVWSHNSTQVRTRSHSSYSIFPSGGNLAVLHHHNSMWRSLQHWMYVLIFLKLRKICIQMRSWRQYGTASLRAISSKNIFLYYILMASNLWYHEFDRFTLKEHFWAMIEYLPLLRVIDVLEKSVDRLKRRKTVEEIHAECQSGI